MPGLNLVVLRARDPKALAAFYSTLGMDFVQHQHGAGPVHFACERDGMVFEIYPTGPDGEPTRGLRIGFEVEDTRESVSRLLGEGAELVSAPRESTWGLRAVLVDPEGHKLELVQAVAVF